MSAFRNAIAFFNNIGLYDVVIPFLLVFTILFAMLEKTAIFGKEKWIVQGKEIERAKKNLNAMVSFCIAFLVVASAELVRVINTVAANAMILLFLSVLFLILVGSFHKQQEFSLEDDKNKFWKTTFMGVMGIGILLVFLDALGWLERVWKFVLTNSDGPVVGSLAFLIILVLAIVWIARDPKAEEKPDGSGAGNGGG